MMTKTEKLLPNLNGIRFIAATTVIFGHVDKLLSDNNYTNKARLYFPFSFAPIAVVLFFVLSGFLITYLLLQEKEVRPISIRGFYLKRILRIWPLYFLVLILSFSYFNNQDYFYWHHITDENFISGHLIKTISLLICISPNVVMLYSSYLGYATQTWSIGVEEQFYLIWPLIIRKSNYLLYIIGIILVMYPLSHGAISSIASLCRRYIGADNFLKLQLLDKFFSGWQSFRIDAMAIGALGAQAALNKISFLQYIFAKKIQLLTYFLFIPLIFNPTIIDYQFYSVLFIIIILNLALNPRSIISLENPVFNYLGKISYGIYMFHMFTIVFSVKLVLNVFNLKMNLLTELLMCLISLILTIGIASISYYLIEKPILRLKNKIRIKDLNLRKL